MRHRPLSLTPRKVGAILDETLVVYARHFWRFIWLVAVFHVPVSVAALVLLRVPDGGSDVWSTTIFTAALFLSIFGIMVVTAAGVFAVGQQYVTGEITIRGCYDRAMWRAKSLLAVTVIGLAALLIIFVPLLVDEHSIMVVLASLLVLPAIVLGIYWSMAVQAVIVEGHKAVGGLGRSIMLVRGSWWRVLWITLLLMLVATGLRIVVTLPFAVLSLIVGADPVASPISSLGSVVSTVVVLPVLFIAGTLLYYDLRVRKEEYNFSTLSREMGIATV